MISAKTNDLPGVNINGMILSQFSLEIKRKPTIIQENKFFSALRNFWYLMTLYNIRLFPTGIRHYEPSGHTVKRYAKPTIFH